ncbi:hypothetical protein FHR83_005977 [Actinoplanes campanulatus]|uniref:Uncharacterized protein n=1 Tax=Actinoplanes campanulatus TaxID=113559 RepID=A0A7W5AL56_9ACTN|nr:hypothetical protein [Actinoplanes campanulatus]MBB3098282.1 hypothetical protein [Actinoplanes campanulatus]GGN34575.1 hypothetical protein GCM10010109_57740 [Actinoplanes campanulatus]GID38760.1 hypothetical protein Aca09nite_52660 [Actinoplanes campanulatus]
MSIPNIGPEHPDSSEPGATDSSRRANPLVYRDEPFADDVFAASTRASAVTHRFGLSRPGGTILRRPPAEEDESDARD